MIQPMSLTLTVPDWLGTCLEPDRRYIGDEEKVALAITLAGRNVAHNTGGPFGAAVFDRQHRLVAAGVNRVVPHGCSVAHAEIMAYMLAQQATGRFRLNAENHGPYVLATSAQPCCQCYGATIWAGIDELLIGARSADVEALTEFDEGPLPADWVGELQRRGIAVRRDICRDEACRVLAAYGESGRSY